MQQFAGLIVGLGNPGPEYAATRHNFGFMVVDRLLAPRGGWDGPGAVAAGNDCRATAASLVPGRPKWLVLEPLTYMNLSGLAVARACRRFAIETPGLVVVHDDMDIELGRMKLRPGGSDAGHNGIRSVIEHLGTEAFLRLRLGVGRPPEGMDPARFVLSPFEPLETGIVDQTARAAVEGLRLLVRLGREAAVRHVNGFLAPSDS